MKKRILCALVALVLTLGLLPTAALAAGPEAAPPAYIGNFTDVSADAYYAQAVQWALEQEVTRGTSHTAFSPDQPCTNLQILTFLYRISGSPAVVTKFLEEQELDQPDPVLWAMEKGLITLEDFDPSAPCTRLQTVTYFWQLAGKPELPSAAEFEAQEAEKAAEAAKQETDPDWNLILVNPWNPIPEDHQVTLTEIAPGYSVDVRCAQALEEMLADCRKAGYSPVVVSAYRTQEVQEFLFYSRVDAKVAAGMSREEAMAATAYSTAVPGTSEHQIGLALDIVDISNFVLNNSQANTPAQRWLMEHCWEYGFILRYNYDKTQITGIMYEPWHYRYVGKEDAKAISHQPLCLEEYLELKESSSDLILWAHQQGITSSPWFHNFLPAATCTRGQIVTFLYRMYQKA